MAACDVWKQTHKNFQNVFSSTEATSMLNQHEMFDLCKDDVPRCKNDPLNASFADELVSSSIFLNEDGNSIDSYDSVIGNDDIHDYIVACWNIKTSSFEYKISDYAHISILNDLLNQGQVTLSDGESDSDDTVFGIFSSDDDNDDDYNHFKDTYYNFCPILDQQYQQSKLEFQYQQQQHHYVDLVEEKNLAQQVKCIICKDYSNEASLVHQDLQNGGTSDDAVINNNPDCAEIDFNLGGVHSPPIEQQQYQLAGTTHNRIEINNNPCTINVPKYDLKKETNNVAGIAISAHQTKTNGVFGNDFRSNKTSQCNDDICNNDEWSSMGFIFTKNNGEYGGGGNISSSCTNYSKNVIFTQVGFHGKDINNVSCNDIDSSVSDTTSVSCSTNMERSTNCRMSLSTSNIIEPLVASQPTAQLENKNKINHRKYVNKRKRKRKRKQHQWIAKNNFFCVKDVIADLVYYCHKYGNKVGVAKTSLNRLQFLFVNNRNKIVNFNRQVQMHNLNHDQMSNFYPLKSLIDTLLQLDIKYGNRIGISKQSYGKLRMLFIGYSIDQIDEAVTNNNIFIKM